MIDPRFGASWREVVDPPGFVLIDVSQYNPVDDWAAVAASGVVGVYGRVAEGVTPDPLFESHRKGAEGVGLIFGAYQYAREHHPADELVRVFRKIAGSGLTLPTMLDIETDDGVSREMVGECIGGWLDEMGENLDDPRPGIYTGAPFWNSNVPRIAYLDAVPLWLAAYVAEEHLKIPIGWAKWSLWQFTDRRKTDGVRAPCDASVFRGTIEELRALALNPSVGAVDVDPA